MSKCSEAVKRWRANTKKKLVQALGGQCVICGYSGYDEVFDLHHLDPSKKDLSFGHITANPAAWSRIAEEAKKCVLLCCMCHRLYHAGYIELPDDLTRFDEARIFHVEELTNICKVCFKFIQNGFITCSRTCAAKHRSPVDWDSIDLNVLWSTLHNYTKIGELVGVSGASVKKRMLKLNIIPR